MNTEARLDQIRGAVPPRNHNARTIAALTSNPGCARRAIMDAAGVDKQRLASCAGFPAQFGQSEFAITRGNAFEAQVKANGCAELLRLLREQLGLPIPEVSYDDLEEVGGNTSRELRHARTRSLLAHAAASGADAGTLFDHPLLRLAVAGRQVYLEPDLIAFQLHNQFHVVEMKSFAVIDGQADGAKVAAAATQSAVYVLALRELLTGEGYGPDSVMKAPKGRSPFPLSLRIQAFCHRLRGEEMARGQPTADPERRRSCGLSRRAGPSLWLDNNRRPSPTEPPLSRCYQLWTVVVVRWLHESTHPYPTSQRRRLPCVRAHRLGCLGCYAGTAGMAAYPDHSCRHRANRLDRCGRCPRCPGSNAPLNTSEPALPQVDVERNGCETI
jgi:hypothetical protein